MTLVPDALTIYLMFVDKRCGRTFVNKGYHFVRPTEWYDGSLNNGFVALHVLIACGKYGFTAVPEGYDVHHYDLNKVNNHPDNLVILTHKAHAQVHAQLRKEKRNEKLNTG